MEMEAGLPLEAGGPFMLVVLILKAIERLWSSGDDYDDDKHRYYMKDPRYRKEWIEREEHKRREDFIRLSDSWQKYERN